VLGSPPISRPPRVRRGGLAVVVALVLGLLVVAACHAADPEAGSAAVPTVEAPAGTPNAVVVVVDDMSDFSCAETAKFLPKSSAWLRQQGTCFEHATVTSPVCCPARGQLVTGQMPHNNGVERQIDARTLDVDDTIQHALGEHGVATYGAGKYLNGVDARDYRRGFDTGFQDFDFWNGMNYWDYKMVDDAGREYKPGDGVHTTVRVGDLITDFVADRAAADQPFYAYAAFHAPHTQNSIKNMGFKDWLPSPTPANARRAVPPLRYHPERDVSDKLRLFGHGRYSEAQYRQLWAARVRALYDIDDQVARIFTTLEDQGVLDETAVFFVSDNGYNLGENGWEGKAVPYPPSIEVPMLAYLPGRFAAGAVDERSVGLVDIAPTLDEIFGLTPNHVLDGKSLFQPFHRKTEYHEFTNEKNRFVLRESGWGPTAVPSWRMIRRGERAYVEFTTLKGRVIAREFYEDRRMERNLLAPQYVAQRPGPGTLTWWRQELHRLASCVGTPGSGTSNPCP
jgi:arylsulfatase A-like enzyme